MERRVKAIQQKLDRLDEAFLFAETIDSTSYEQQRHRLREEFTLFQIDHILALAERSQTYGAGLARSTSSDCSSCSFLRESRTTELDSIEPPRHRFSSTWRRLRVLKKAWGP
jgi:hypothetical protein